MHTVIFACIHNAGRSQMAAAFFRQLADPGKARCLSAGTNPGNAVHPVVLDTMREIGIDLSGVTPQKLTPELAQGASLLITLGCGEECPYIPGLEILDWPLEDPKGKDPATVLRIREEVRQRVQSLLQERGWAQ